MKIQSRSKPYFIPEYSLTGDLLSFLTCNLQYRYQNKGTLPPSMPIQLWFGEFIHGVMEEAFLKWEDGNHEFPWSWELDIRPIEEMIDQRLRSRGLNSPPRQFCPEHLPEEAIGKYKLEDNPYHRIASARAEKAINIWGKNIFPLIKSTELLIKGIRDMPNYNDKSSRSNRYGINGVVDGLLSINANDLKTISNINPVPNDNSTANNTYNNHNSNNNQTSLELFLNQNNDNENNKKNNNEKNSENDTINLFIKSLKENKQLNEFFNKEDIDDFEIIIDYKGMKRPAIDSETYKHHKWQVLTYSWLRSQQKDAKEIPAGVILYLNELVPSTMDLIAIKEDIINKKTDVEISQSDKESLFEWDGSEKYYPTLSDEFRINRSIRIIPINKNEQKDALSSFDKVVNNIETSLIKEENGCKISESWTGEADKRTCDACDFKMICQKNKGELNDITVP